MLVAWLKYCDRWTFMGTVLHTHIQCSHTYTGYNYAWTDLAWIYPRLILWVFNSCISDHFGQFRLAFYLDCVIQYHCEWQLNLHLYFTFTFNEEAAKSLHAVFSPLLGFCLLCSASENKQANPGIVHGEPRVVHASPKARHNWDPADESTGQGRETCEA